MIKKDKIPNRIMKKDTYNPVKRAEEVAGIVCRNDLRKYYRFRPARFYGGIATADCVGCCLRCLFCWSWHQVAKPQTYGHFYSPHDVAKEVTKIARKKCFKLLRITGNEPTLGRGHLLRVLEFIPPNFQFILETNGILIGHDKTYAEDLAKFHNLHVRVSLKGANEDEFSAVTGAEPGGFTLQIQALENLLRAGVEVHPAVMVSFSRAKHIEDLRNRLKRIDLSFQDIEIEELVFWGDVEERLRKRGL